VENVVYPNTALQPASMNLDLGSITGLRNASLSAGSAGGVA
jgi:hypothetical protein